MKLPVLTGWSLRTPQLAGLPKSQSATITSPSDPNVIDLKADMRYNYITVEAQWVGSVGTGPTGSSLPPSFELLSAEAVTLSDSGR